MQRNLFQDNTEEPQKWASNLCLSKEIRRECTKECLGWGLVTAISMPDSPPAHLSNASYLSLVTLSPASQTLEIWKFKSRFIEQRIRVKKVLLSTSVQGP